MGLFLKSNMAGCSNCFFGDFTNAFFETHRNIGQERGHIGVELYALCFSCVPMCFKKSRDAIAESCHK